MAYSESEREFTFVRSLKITPHLAELSSKMSDLLMRRLPMLAHPVGSLELTSDDLKDTSLARTTFKSRLKAFIFFSYWHTFDVFFLQIRAM